VPNIAIDTTEEQDGRKNHKNESGKADPDYYQDELKRTGVTRQLLWEEYVAAHPGGYSYSQFCYHLQQIAKTARPTMHLEHKPGDKLYIDFAGKTLAYIDAQSGEQITCQVFVACLPYSDYGFALAVEDQSVGSLLYALGRCLAELGGVPASIVTDNLKSAVSRPDRYEPSIQQSLEDFANHYGTTIIPTRVYKPRDKALVENQVKLIYQRVYAQLRDQRFFDLGSLNKAITARMLAHNQRRMQQKPFCRQELFLAKERTELKPLPGQPYELKKYKRLRAAKNNHVFLSDDKHYYSLPYACIGQMVDLVYTRNMVHIYCKGKQVAVHVRSYAMGGYSTKADHLCSWHKDWQDRSPQYYQSRAERIHPALGSLVEKIFQQDRHPEQLYKTCEGILGLYKRSADPWQVIRACQIALQYQEYSYRFIRNLIDNRIAQAGLPEATLSAPLPVHQNLRGKNYYQTLLNFNTNEAD
jgi:transposase